MDPVITGFVDEFCQIKLAELGVGQKQKKLTYPGTKKLTPKGREKIQTKNFAIPGKEKYPIHDVEHARNALVRVRTFGSPSERSQVYSAVTKKYPALATRSSVVPQKLQRKAERKAGVGKGQESMKLEKPKQKIG